MSQTYDIWRTLLRDFRDTIESRATPGCGAAAAVSASFGLALVLKGLRRGETGQDRAECAALIARGDAFEDRLARLANDDVAAFEAYLAAMKLPHDTAESTARRNAAIHDAIEQASAIPLAIARTCLDGLGLAIEARAWTSSHLQSDTQAGARLLHAGLCAVLAGVDANLSGLRDAHEREAMVRERHALQQAADSRLAVLD